MVYSVGCGLWVLPCADCGTVELIDVFDVECWAMLGEVGGVGPCIARAQTI